MTKYITYEEKQLKQSLDYIQNALNHIQFWADMMREQSEGKSILSDVEKIKNALKTFKL